MVLILLLIKKSKQILKQYFFLKNTNTDIQDYLRVITKTITIS